MSQDFTPDEKAAAAARMERGLRERVDALPINLQEHLRRFCDSAGPPVRAGDTMEFVFEQGGSLLFEFGEAGAVCVIVGHIFNAKTIADRRRIWIP